jgi:hypothetical protein
MSSSNPPYPYYNGISYNSSFFTTNTGSGLSQAKANTLYLQKTTTDTATALETFTGGIKTNSIDTVASTDNLTINSGTGNTTLGASSGTVYIGSAQVGLGSIIQLGTSVTTARVAGSISTPSIYPSTASGTLTIGNDGLNTISIGGSTGRTAPISIGTGSSTANGTVLISNNANSTSSIKIGDGSGQSSNIFIGSNNATAPASTFNNVLIGASTKSLYLNGSIYMNDGGGSLTMGSSGTSYISLGAMNTTFNIGGANSPFHLTSDAIDIGSQGLSASGSVSIAAGTNITGSYAQLGSDTLPYNYIRAKNLELNANNSGTTKIGWVNGANYGTNSVLGRSLLGGGSDNFPSALINVSTLSTSIRDGIAIKSVGQNALWYCVWLNQSNTIIGRIEGDGTTVVYSTASDRRLKKDVVPMENILDKIMLLKPCDYNWISNDKSSFGFIAQEVFEVFPKMYIEARNSDGNIDEPCDKDTGVPCHYGIDYGKFTPYIVKAIQEIKEDYETKLSKLEERIFVLEKATLSE